MSNMKIHVSGGAKVSNVRVNGSKDFSMRTKGNEVQITRDGVVYTFTGTSAALDNNRLFVDGREVLDPWGTAKKVRFDHPEEKSLFRMALVVTADIVLLLVLRWMTEGTTHSVGAMLFWVLLNIGFVVQKASKSSQS